MNLSVQTNSKILNLYNRESNFIATYNKHILGFIYVKIVFKRNTQEIHVCVNVSE